MSEWNAKQKKFLSVYMVLWPVQTMILVYFFFFSVNKMHAIKVLEGLFLIFSPENPYGIKGYFLVIFYAWGKRVYSYYSPAETPFTVFCQVQSF
jgi:hypothetical protein